MGAKQRLDQALKKRGLAASRQKAAAVILSGKVLVNQIPVDKPGRLVQETDDIVIKGESLPYVSRGGLKLEAALRSFDIAVAGMTCLDVGASTGGFTDCLLQHGAHMVYALDVGYGQLAWKLRQDERVVVFERTNVRYMPADALPCAMDLITIDVSFISLRIVIPAVLPFLHRSGIILALIKPQFEVGKHQVGKKGVVKDPDLHEHTIQEMIQFGTSVGLHHRGVLPSPILGPKGNKEFFILFDLDFSGLNR